MPSTGNKSQQGLFIDLHLKKIRQVVVQLCSKERFWLIFLPLLLYCLCLLILFAVTFLLTSHSFSCTFLYFIFPSHIKPFPDGFPSLFSLFFFPLIAVLHFTLFSFLLLPLLFLHGEFFDSSIPTLLPLMGITPNAHPLIWRATGKKKDLISEGSYSIARRRTEK